LAELATRQHGVVSTRQLAELGYNRSSAAKANGVGRLHRIYRGVYRVGHTDLSWEGRCMAAVLAARPAVASHWTAAWIWGLLARRPGTLHVTCPNSRRAKRPFATHTADLPESDRTVRDEIPVTSVARTILDISVGSRVKTVGRFIERADEAKVFDLGEMRGLLDRFKGHQGAATVRAALDAYRPERRFTRSGFERRFFELVREAGLPEPAMNVFVAGRELDAYWEEECFGVELDSWATHGSRLSFEEDRLRVDEFLLAGILVTRVTESRLDREPAEVVASLRTHLSRRAVIE
jgi:predicted transcriptional regulator of viral defense system